MKIIMKRKNQTENGMKRKKGMSMKRKKGMSIKQKMRNVLLYYCVNLLNKNLLFPSLIFGFPEI